MRRSRVRHDISRSLVGFWIGESHCAVPVALVREVSRPLRIAKVPGARDAVAGVAEYRQEVVAVIDMRRRFGMPPMSPGGRPKWIVLDAGSRRLALVVDSVTGVFGSVEGERLAAPPIGADGSLGIAWTTRWEKVLTFVLDVVALEELAVSVASSPM